MFNFKLGKKTYIDFQSNQIRSDTDELKRELLIKINDLALTFLIRR